MAKKKNAEKVWLKCTAGMYLTYPDPADWLIIWCQSRRIMDNYEAKPPKNNGTGTGCLSYIYHHAYWLIIDEHS